MEEKEWFDLTTEEKIEEVKKGIEEFRENIINRERDVALEKIKEDPSVAAEWIDSIIIVCKDMEPRLLHLGELYERRNDEEKERKAKDNTPFEEIFEDDD